YSFASFGGGNPDFLINTFSVFDKINQHPEVYPQGYVTSDNSWVARFTTAQQQDLINKPDGSANISSGKGIQSLGMMLANSKGFPKCMAKRVFENICVRSATIGDDADITR